jgi:hypothetical protein
MTAICVWLFIVKIIILVTKLFLNSILYYLMKKAAALFGVFLFYFYYNRVGFFYFSHVFLGV